MTKKPKFLKRWSDLSDDLQNYAQLLRKRKAGKPDDFYMSTEQLRSHYHELTQLMRSKATITEHIKWQIVYDRSFRSAIESGKSAKDAKLSAQRDVAEKFDVTIQHIQRSIITKE